MSLNASLSKFKNELSTAAARNINHSRPASSAPTRTTTPKPNDAVTKRTHDTAFAASQTPAAGTPAAAALATRATGSELMTQVWTAIKYLKEKSPSTIPFEDIISYLSLPTDASRNIPLIRRALRESERAQYVSDKAGFRYRPLIPVTNAEELKDYIARSGQESAMGVSVKDLKDGWPTCTDALDELEKQGFILVTRWKKDNMPRTVYADSPSYHILNSNTGLPQKIDADFVDVWAKTKLPASEADVRAELVRAELTPTSAIKETKRDAGPKRKEKRRVVRKNGKTTNSHMMGILKDYSQRR